MLFNSFEFILCFLPICLFGYYFLIRRHLTGATKVWLLICSLFFYAFGNFWYLYLLLFSILLNYFLGKRISDSNCHFRKIFLISGISINILLLGIFKYANFFIENINLVSNYSFPAVNILLPLAISFFTFQQIAYLVDMYKSQNYCKYSLSTYMLFVCFFPQLIAGPIVAHGEMIPQFECKRNFIRNWHNIFQGSLFFIIGLFKKVVIADTFSQYVTLGFDEIDSLTFVGGWFTSISYTLQIYFDFSGYCDMALGCAKFFNINLPINFNSPYKATNIQDFWHRWHITLSRFLKDYLYIPLGGNRKGVLRTYINIALVFLIGGLWHGAAWTFVFWGFLHGIANIIYRLWKKTGLHLNKFIAWLIMFNFINITWIFFRANNFSSAFKVIKAMFNIDSLRNLPALRSKYYLAGFNVHGSFLCITLLMIIVCILFPNSVKIVKMSKITNLRYAYLWGIGCAFIFLFLLAKMLIIPYTEFIYFNF